MVHGCQPAAHTKPSKSSRESGRGWRESTVYVVREHSMQEFRGSARITGHLPPDPSRGLDAPNPSETGESEVVANRDTAYKKEGEILISMSHESTSE